MENQHKKIKGYRDLTIEEIDMMNNLKIKANEVGEIIAELQKIAELDQRWIAIGKTDLQKGFMSIIRGIAQPESF